MDKWINTFNSIAPSKHRYDIFRDFVIASALGFHNEFMRCLNNQKLPGWCNKYEQEFISIHNSYDKEDRNKFLLLFHSLVDLLDDKPWDVLGTLYMKMELSNKHTGQFMTPSDVSELMAKMSFEVKKPFTTLSDPCCGTGGFPLACANLIIQKKLIPAYKLWIQAIDVDRVMGYGLCLLPTIISLECPWRGDCG